MNKKIDHRACSIPSAVAPAQWLRGRVPSLAWLLGSALALQACGAGETEAEAIDESEEAASPAFLVGQHFHAIPGDGGTEVNHSYNIARTHNHYSGYVGLNGFWLDHDTYDWTHFDAFVNLHTSNGAKIIFTAFSSPNWASSRPWEPNHYYPGMPGGLAAPADLDSWGRMISAVVQRYGNSLAAVECWNEPFGNSPDEKEFFSGSQTELADMCKALYQAVKATDPSMPVISPAQGYTNSSLMTVLDAHTSQGEPMSNFYDWFGSHPYNYTGPNGPGYDLAGELDYERSLLDSYGLADKPLIITEWGMLGGVVPPAFCALPSEERANVLYDTAKTAHEKGLRGFVYYAYDNTGDLCGHIGIQGSDGVTAEGITRATNDFGSLTPVEPPVDPPVEPMSEIRVNAGGPSTMDHLGNTWEADRGAEGGGIVDRGEIEILGTNDPALYRTERWGMNRYGLEVPAGSYQVFLHFAETYEGITGAGQRVFDVDVEGQLLSNVDVFALAGGARTALVLESTVDVTDGMLDIGFLSKIQSPMINAIEVRPVPASELRINVGGEALVDHLGQSWAPDSGFTGGGTADRGNIEITGTNDPALYRTERWGMSGYGFDLPSGNYKVRLHFAETYDGITGPGQRVFDVDVEGTAIPNLDIFALAGGARKAYVVESTVAVTDGKLDIGFAANVQSPMINAIEVSLAP